MDVANNVPANAYDGGLPVYPGTTSLMAGTYTLTDAWAYNSLTVPADQNETLFIDDGGNTQRAYALEDGGKVFENGTIEVCESVLLYKTSCPATGSTVFEASDVAGPDLVTYDGTLERSYGLDFTTSGAPIEDGGSGTDCSSAPVCTGLASGAAVQVTNVNNSTVAAAGGTVPDGTYVLVADNVYDTGNTLTPGPTDAWHRGAIRISGSGTLWEEVDGLNAGALARGTGVPSFQDVGIVHKVSVTPVSCGAVTIAALGNDYTYDPAAGLASNGALYIYSTTATGGFTEKVEYDRL